MIQRLEITPGTPYGELTVLRELGSTSGKRYFRCLCSCGNERTVRLDHLRSGHTSSCGKCGLEWMGERRTLVEWARAYNINESTLRARLKVMSIGEALARK